MENLYELLKCTPMSALLSIVEMKNVITEGTD